MIRPKKHCTSQKRQAGVRVRVQVKTYQTHSILILTVLVDMSQLNATTSDAYIPYAIKSFQTAESLVEMRKRCLQALDGILPLVNSICSLLHQTVHDETSDNIQNIFEQLSSVYSNVKDLELRMCIVAPMKAGKSTIINAIFGQNILPTRNAAMTVIPTEVKLRVVQPNDEAEEALLLMDKELIEQIRSMQREIRLHLANSRTSEDLKRKLPEHTHLVSLAQEIRDALYDGHLLEERSIGIQHIRETLQYVNDVIRLHELLVPTESTISSRHLFKKLPRITAPYVALGDEIKMFDSLGNLVIVDTPGPNENTTTNFLKDIIIRELRKAIVILVVLDYTALNTEADNLVKTEILNIRQATSANDDSLFALVNKVDRRRQGDMSPTEVYDLVRNKFNIGQVDLDHQTTNRIFEVQAYRALLAKQFLKDVNDTNQNESVQITNLKSGSDFLAEAYGAAYDEDDPPTLDKAKRDAWKLWRKSGFNTFLNGAVERLVERAAPRAIESALSRCDACLCHLHEILTVREKLLCADENSLRLQSDALRTDMQKVHEAMEKQITVLNDEQIKIITHFQTQFKQMKTDALDNLTKVLNSQFLSESHTVNSAAVTTAGTDISPFVARSYLHNMMLKVAKALADHAAEGGILKFKDEREGRNFIRNIERQIRAISEDASTKIQADVDKECELACARLNQHLQKTTEEILRTARSRLASTFNIQFQKPPMLNFVHSTSADFELKLQKIYRPWWLLWLVSISYDDGHIEGTIYQIRVSSLTKHCISQLQNHMNAIEEQLNTYLTDVLKLKFDEHFNELMEYLLLYQNYIKKSLNDQARTMDEKAKLKEFLKEFVTKIDHQIKVVNNIQESFESRAHPTSVENEY